MNERDDWERVSQCVVWQMSVCYADLAASTTLAMRLTAEKNSAAVDDFRDLIVKPNTCVTFL